MHNQGYALGKAQFDKENKTKTSLSATKPDTSNMSVTDKIEYYRNLA